MCTCNTQHNHGGGRMTFALGGLGDIFSVNDSGDPIDVSGQGGGSGNDWVNPYPASTIPQPTVGPTNSVNWNNLLSIFANTGSKIALATTGSNPTYQTVGPQGSTTVYGNPTSALTLPGGLTSGMGIGTIAVLGIGLVVIMSMMKK